MFDHVKQDLNRCGCKFSEQLREALFNPGTWAVLSYRLRRRMYTLGAPNVIRKVVSLFSSIMQVCTVVMTNIDLPVTAKIGPGLYIPHTGFIVVTVDAIIGSNCTLTQGVTIGHGKGGKSSDNAMPVIGDRVYLGPSSVVIGGVTVGHDALIGAGAIVTRSVPAGGVVVGNPAHLISTAGSFDLISYPDMLADKNRAASIAVLRPREAEATDLPVSI